MSISVLYSALRGRVGGVPSRGDKSRDVLCKSTYRSRPPDRLYVGRVHQIIAGLKSGAKYDPFGFALLFLRYVMISVV